jgi:dihydroorotate dehydrogenase electron transfer subunit
MNKKMQCELLKIRRFGEYAHLTLDAPAIARHARPGQFVEVKIAGAGAPFWRRPFSICRAVGHTLELLIKSVGLGSRLMTRMKPGELVDIIGPLGRGFKLPGQRPVVLIGGGFGVAPLLFLAERLKMHGRKTEVMIGGRCADDLLLRRELQLTGARVACATEDGSFGVQGRVTLLLEKRLSQPGAKPQIAAAGPRPMLAAIARLAAERNCHAEVSLEEVMACGLGGCNGCVIKTLAGFQRVCKDGPVFLAQEVEWEETCRK